MGVATAETESIRKDAGIEGELEFGQKNISTLKRNLLNTDEILRIPQSQLLVNIRGNKPLLLDKMIYTEHELANKLKDVSIQEYKPNWNDKNIQDKKTEKEPKKISEEKNEDITFDNF